jgi:hypothetical protein
MKKPDISVVLGLGHPGHGEPSEDDSDGDSVMSEDDHKEAKDTAVQELLEGISARDKDKMCDALETFFNLCANPPPEDMPQDDGDSEGESTQS